MREAHAKSNKAIFDELSEIVIGHSEAKKVLINIINRSKLHYYSKYGLLEPNESIKLSNCLLVGESGTGKTFLIETLSKIMEFPFVKIDATELNPTGASGGIKKKDLIKKLIDKAEELIETKPNIYWSLEGTLDQMVVFVDEVDKLGQQLSSDWNAHVQANFLTLFENKGQLQGVTYIFAGAFSGMEKRDFKLGNKLGFVHQKDDIRELEDVTSSVVKFGMLPEFVGRLNNIVVLDKLEMKDYRSILDKIIIPKVGKSMELYGIENFKLPESKLEELVNVAFKSGLGVRALESGVNKLLVDFEFDPTTYVDEPEVTK